MTELITLTCPACNGKLEIDMDKEIDRFACGYCGNEYVVNRGGIVSLSPVVEGLKQVQLSSDRVVSELAIARLEKEIRELQDEVERVDAKWNWGNNNTWGSAVVAGFLVFVIIGVGYGDFSRGFSFGVTAFVLYVLSHVVSEQRDKKRRIPPLEQQIARKREELLRHRKVIEG